MKVSKTATRSDYITSILARVLKSFVCYVM